jgi:hypothetical protein
LSLGEIPKRPLRQPAKMDRVGEHLMGSCKRQRMGRGAEGVKPLGYMPLVLLYFFDEWL